MTATTEPTRAQFGSGIADPGPLGLAAFAMTTFFLSAVNAKLLPATVEGVVFGLAFFYGGIAQLLAGMWEFAKGNTFGAMPSRPTARSGCPSGTCSTHLPEHASADDLNKGIGAYLLAWTIFTAYMFIASTRTSVALMAVFAFLALTFLFPWPSAPTALSESMTKIGGWLGLITAVVAWYASLAGVMNATYKRVVFPVLPRS